MSPKRFFVPSLFTCLNFFWGIASLIQIESGNFHAGSWYIILAILCDGMDGKLARAAGAESPLGLELDSLADLVSSGVAPGVLAYSAALVHFRFIGLVVVFIFIVSGGYRLARFNIVQKGDRSRGYSGLPLPVSGFTVAGFWLFSAVHPEAGAPVQWMILMLVLSVLQTSSISYSWPSLRFTGNRTAAVLSTAVLVMIFFLAVFPYRSIFPIFVFYIVLGVGRWIYRVLYRGVSWKTAYPDLFRENQ